MSPLVSLTRDQMPAMTDWNMKAVTLLMVAIYDSTTFAVVYVVIEVAV